MPPHRDVQKKYCSRALIGALVVGAGFILAGFPGVGKGLIAGTLSSILNFILIAESLPGRLGQSRTRASLASLGWILLRYGLMAVPLVLALRFSLFHPVAAAAGLFAVQIVILCEHLLASFASAIGRNA
jgi:hypothetical protein